jgi:hypothetical protein
MPARLIRAPGGVVGSGYQFEDESGEGVLRESIVSMERAPQLPQAYHQPHRRTMDSGAGGTLVVGDDDEGGGGVLASTATRRNAGGVDDRAFLASRRRGPLGLAMKASVRGRGVRGRGGRCLGGSQQQPTWGAPTSFPPGSSWSWYGRVWGWAAPCPADS